MGLVTWFGSQSRPLTFCFWRSKPRIRPSSSTTAEKIPRHFEIKGAKRSLGSQINNKRSREVLSSGRNHGKQQTLGVLFQETEQTHRNSRSETTRWHPTHDPECTVVVTTAGENDHKSE